MKCLAAPPTSGEQDLPLQIRVSLGSAIVIGLLEGKLNAEPTTAYLMTFRTGKCSANCGFCPQARSSQSRAELLSRVSWPAFSSRSVLDGIESAVQAGKIKRVCIQALNYPNVFSYLAAFVKALKQHVTVPVSVSCQPLNKANMQRLAEAGVDRIGIALDAATEEVFDAVKGSGAGGPYNWGEQFRQLREAVEFFGRGNVSTHVIVGLGETEKDAVGVIQECVDMGVLPALFAFTPVHGTALALKPQPKLEVYRRVQVARHLIVNHVARADGMRFDSGGRIVSFGVGESQLEQVVKSGAPFLTSGCSGCNRPFYNEKPSGPFYNYARKMTPEEIAVAKKQLTLK